MEFYVTPADHTASDNQRRDMFSLLKCWGKCIFSERTWETNLVAAFIYK